MHSMTRVTSSHLHVVFMLASSPVNLSLTRLPSNNPLCSSYFHLKTGLGHKGVFLNEVGRPHKLNLDQNLKQHVVTAVKV